MATKEVSPADMKLAIDTILDIIVIGKTFIVKSTLVLTYHVGCQLNICWKNVLQW